jgi:hypothetical protein
MPLESNLIRPGSQAVNAGPDRWLHWTAGIWVVLCLVLLTRSFLQPQRQTVYHNYSKAGLHWLAGTDAYEVPRDASNRPLARMSAYRYSPLFSAMSAPLAQLPDQWGGMFWRLLSYAGYLAALACYARQVLPGAQEISAKAWACWWLLLIPLSLPSMNNGQANVLMLALMLASGVAVVQERWNLAALALAAAFFMKLYPVAIALIFVLVYPRQLGWRFALAVLAGLFLPFALHRPSYIWGQYDTWYYLLMQDDRDNFPLLDGYRDFYMLARWAGVAMTAKIKMLVQLGTAGLTASICLWGRLAHWPKQHLVHSIVSLSCCWIIAFGPATESCTYILLAPVLSWALVDAFAHGRVWERNLLVTVLAMFLAYSIASWFPDGRNWCYVLQPFGALLFFLERSVYACLWRDEPAKQTVAHARAA